MFLYVFIDHVPDRSRSTMSNCGSLLYKIRRICRVSSELFQRHYGYRGNPRYQRSESDVHRPIIFHSCDLCDPDPTRVLPSWQPVRPTSSLRCRLSGIQRSALRTVSGRSSFDVRVASSPRTSSDVISLIVIITAGTQQPTRP